MSATQTRAATQSGTLTGIVYVARKVEADLLAIIDTYGCASESWASNVMHDVRILMDEEVIEKVFLTWTRHGSFTQAEARADALKGQPLLLLIDEADALAAKRVDQHMHHEDKAGLNTLLQRIDGLRLSGRRMVVLFITNRPDALDPAVRRRAALRLTFRRPDDDQRAELLRQSIPEVEISTRHLRELVAATGVDAEKKHGTCFTWSDITDRLVPAALRDAYAEQRPLAADDLIRYARELEPTPLMQEE